MILVMMQHAWGKGETIDEADKIARREGGHGRKKVSRIVFHYDPEKTTKTYIDGMGRLCWEGERPLEVERVKV